MLGQQEAVPLSYHTNCYTAFPLFSQPEVGHFSSCKINSFHNRATWSAELESILVLLGLKCERPQIFQELETSKSGSGFTLPWKASMVHTHLVCTAVFLWWGHSLALVFLSSTLNWMYSSWDTFGTSISSGNFCNLRKGAETPINLRWRAP